MTNRCRCFPLLTTFFIQQNGYRPSYNITGSHHHGMLSFCGDTIVFKKFNNPGRRTGSKARLPYGQPAYVHGMKTVNIFSIVN